VTVISLLQQNKKGRNRVLKMSRDTNTGKANRKTGSGILKKMALAGRVAVITGAGRGIGARAAELLARHGASVVINDMSAEVLTNTINFFSSTSVEIYLLAICLVPRALPVA